MEALVTGASGLIGTEICRKYLSAGFKVYGLDKTAGKLKDPNYSFIKCNLAQESSIRRSVKSIKSLNVVVCTAAEMDISFKPFKNMTVKDWNLGLAVNLSSIFILGKLLFPLLKSSRGSFVSIASTRHLMSEPGGFAYSASKGGIIALTHAMAMTWGPEVRVNCISPGWIVSPDEKRKPKDHKQHPVGRIGYPTDISEMTFYLTSAKAGFITGQDFIVDGGMTRKMIYE